MKAVKENVFEKNFLQRKCRIVDFFHILYVLADTSLVCREKWKCFSVCTIDYTKIQVNNITNTTPIPVLTWGVYYIVNWNRRGLGLVKQRSHVVLGKEHQFFVLSVHSTFDFLRKCNRLGINLSKCLQANVLRRTRHKHTEQKQRRWWSRFLLGS